MSTTGGGGSRSRVVAERCLVALVLGFVSLAMVVPMFRSKATPTRGKHTCYRQQADLLDDVHAAVAAGVPVSVPSAERPVVEVGEDHVRLLQGRGPSTWREVLGRRAEDGWLGSSSKPERLFLVRVPPGAPEGRGPALAVGSLTDRGERVLVACSRHGAPAFFSELDSDRWSARDLIARLGYDPAVQEPFWTRAEMEAPFANLPSAAAQDVRDWLTYSLGWLILLSVPAFLASLRPKAAPSPSGAPSDSR